MNRIRNHPKTHRFTAFLLCLSMIVSTFSGIGFGSPFTARAEGGNNANVGSVTSGVKHQADPSTMDTYKEMLNFDENSRYAGRLWTDKTVFAYGQQYTGSGNDDGRSFGNNKLNLTKSLDGVEGSISLDADFLHVFSALGSSEVVNKLERSPVDLVVGLDITASLLDYWVVDEKTYETESEEGLNAQTGVGKDLVGSRGFIELTDYFQYNSFDETKWNVNKPVGHISADEYAQISDEEQKKHYQKPNMSALLEAVNTLIKGVREDSPHTRISIVVYWGSSYTMIPFVEGTPEFLGYGMELDSSATVDKKEDRKPGNMEGIFYYTIKDKEDNPILYGRFSPSTAKNQLLAPTDVVSAPVDYTKLEWSKHDSDNTKIEVGSGVNVVQLGNEVFQLAAGTGIQAGIRGALKELADNKLPKEMELSNGEKIPYTPVAVIATDGESNHVLARNGDSDIEIMKKQNKDAVWLCANGWQEEDGPNGWAQNGGYMRNTVTVDGDWWDVYENDKHEPIAVNVNLSKIEDNSVDDNNKTNPVANFSAVLTGAYWRVLAQKNYKNDLKVYTVGVSGEAANAATVLDPVNDKTCGSIAAYNMNTLWNKWINGESLNISSKVEWVNTNKSNWGAKPFDLCRVETEYTFSKLPATKEDVTIENGTAQVSMEEMKLGYNDRYNLAKDVSELNDVFAGMVSEINSTIFAPIGGANDLGVDSAITYRDPIGKYMEVKDVKNITLFGKKYDMTKTAMYNYNFVSKHRQSGTEGTFKEGWYHFDANGDWYGDAKGEGDAWKLGLSDPKCYSETLPEGVEGWIKLDDGSSWAYFVGSNNARKFLPTVAADGTVSEMESDPEKKDQVDKFKNTTYTFYRIADRTDRNELHVNPVYIPEGKSENEVIGGVRYDGENQKHLRTPGVYALSDLRIWVEDTGDYNDNAEHTISDTNFDEALFVNLPVNMLPLRTVTINPDKEDTARFTYTTNLQQNPETVEANTAESASFPFRVFYTVGMEESRLTKDRGIDIASVSPEYISQNKAQAGAWAQARGLQENDIEFFSNWYNPEHRYGAYVTTGTDYTYGDPMVSFSPSTDNRYYVFQRPLPLYKRALVWVPDDDLKLDENKNLSSNQVQKGGLWKVSKINEDYTPSADDRLPGETYSPSDFGGEVLVADLKCEALDEVNTDTAVARKENQDKIWEALNREMPGLENGKSLAKGTVIFLEQDQLKDVTKANPDPFSSDGYYFMAIDYYNLKGDDNSKGDAELVNYAVTRKGSEFGSAYKASGITNGDMLCWYDTSGKYSQTYPYLSYTDTQNKSRGRDFIGFEIDPQTGWYKGKDSKQLPTDEEKPNQVDPNSMFKQGNWVVAAKPGGLRVGDLAQAVGAKTFGQNGATLTQYNDYRDLRFPDKKDSKDFLVRYYGGNTTRTANSYYMPTISTSSDTGKQDIVVNVYLGNNGRLWTNSTLLLVTKLLEKSPGVENLPENSADKKFDFQATVKGLNGEVDAVRVRYNEAQGAWQRQLHYIDMTLGQKYCLENPDGTPVKVNENGDVDPNGQYYVFVGKNSGDTQVQQKDHTFRIYHNPACEISSGKGVSPNDVLVKLYKKDGTQEDYAGGELPIEETGKRDFYAKKVWLVTDDQRNDITEEGKPPRDAIEKTDFYLANLDPTDAETSDSKVTSPYLTSSEYLTQKVYFGYDNGAMEEWLEKDENKKSGKTLETMTEDERAPFKLDKGKLFDSTQIDDITDLANNTAQFTLQSGWGLLFPGLESGTKYRLVEKISQEDLNQGYSFKRVEHVQQERTITYNAANDGKDSDTEKWGFDNQNRTYSIFGDTGGTEEAGHFVNTWSSLKTETHINDKNATPSNADGSAYPGVRVGDEITYNIKWYNDAKGNNGAAAKANVQIIDPLDEGVDFVSASDGGQYFKDAVAANAWLSENKLPKFSAAGDESKAGNGFVIWNLGEQAANAKGSVTLTVKVNDKAQQFWDYDGDGNGDKPVNPGNPEPDFLVRNRATVRVADHSYNTNTVVNPVGKPSKTETRIERRSTASDTDSSPIEVKKPNESDPEKVPDANLLLHEDGKFHGPLVFVGDKITYEIEWQNYRSEPAAITIRDPLDPNVRFVSASFKPADFKDGEGNNLNLADNDKLSVLNEELNQSIAADADGKIEDIATTGTKINGYGTNGEDERDVIAYSKPDKNKDSSHEVTWNLGVMPSGAHGKVTLVVEVLDSATPVGYVDNTAYVTVNGDPEQQTETIENPTPRQKKTEITPRDGVMVGIGDSITYQIDWHNFESVPADVLIMDTLDPGVDFVSADNDGKYYKSEEKISPKDSAGQPITIPAHTVVWNLGKQPANASGTVTLTVKVNENAKKAYVYNDNADELTSPTENNDYEVLNQARVKVGNNPFTKTEIVDNPVPDKTETEIEHNSYGNAEGKKENVTEAGKGANLKQQDDGNDANQNQQKDVKWQGPRVYVGDVITYQIHWKNGHNEKADVTITDQLDPGVDFYEAKVLASPSNANDVTLASSSDAKPNENTITGENGDITIGYSKENHTVTWTLANREPKAEGDVLLKVMINEKAVPVGYVDNQASVKVGDDPAVNTKIIENPTPHVEKTEISPGEGMQVMPDDGIEYEISWYNYEKKLATVTITDKLDPGVDFLEAAYGDSKLIASKDTKKPETANLTISLAGKEGTDKVFTFTLDLKLPEGKEFPAEGYRWERNQATGNEDVEEQAGTWTNTEGGRKLTLKPGESITVKALPVGTTYTLASEDGKNIVTNVTLGKYGSQVQVTVSNIRISTPSNEIATPPNEKATPSGFSDASRIPTRTPIGHLIDAVKSLLGIETESRIEQTVYEFSAVVVDEPMPIADPEDDGIEELAQDEPIVDPEGDGIDELTQNEPIADPEDDGIEELAQNEQTGDKPTEFKTTDQYGEVIIRYYPKSHKVVWVLENRPMNFGGVVKLKVRVNEDAEKFWSYDHPEWGPSDNKKDDRVRNQAGVKVGNHPEVKTRIIENPTKPEKTETQINDKDVSRDLVADENGYVGPNVNVGDTITYRIRWQNNAKDESGQLVRAEITITDKLDPGVEFVEASDGGNYDPDTHTVVWELGEKDPRERGYVTLKVRVTSAALDDWDTVENMATVTVGNVFTDTNRVENPLGDLGALTVTKTVTGNLGDQTKGWNFRVELSDNTIEGAFGEMTFKNGVAEFTLKHGESKTASGLPVGITYTVTENEANADGYTTTASGDTGTIQKKVIAEAVFVNHKSDEPKTPPDNPPDTPHGPTPKTPTEPTPENPPVVPPPPGPTQPQPLEEVSFMAPTTGDTSPIGKWILILVMALAGIGISAHQLFRRKTEDPDE